VASWPSYTCNCFKGREFYRQLALIRAWWPLNINFWCYIDVVELNKRRTKIIVDSMSHATLEETDDNESAFWDELIDRKLKPVSQKFLQNKDILRWRTRRWLDSSALVRPWERTDETSHQLLASPALRPLQKMRNISAVCTIHIKGKEPWGYPLTSDINEDLIQLFAKRMLEHRRTVHAWRDMTWRCAARVVRKRRTKR